MPPLRTSQTTDILGRRGKVLRTFFFYQGEQLSRQKVELTGFIIWLLFAADITGGLIGQL